MQKMDIEKLLQWALREELPKGHPVAASAWETTVERFAFLGVRVDVSHPGSADGLGFVPGEPHPDALLVAAAIRKLPRDFQLSASACRRLLGHFAALDPAAVKAVAGAKFNMPALVIRCAVLGQRFPFDIGHPQVKPKLRYDRQRWAVSFYIAEDGLAYEAKANNRGNYPAWSETPLDWHEPSIGEVLEVRAEYAIWHCALELLCRDLAGVLREHAVLAPIATPEPWHNGQAPAPVVRAGTPLADNRPLPLTPTGRPRMLRPLEPDIVIAKRKARSRETAEARKERARKSADLARLNGSPAF